MQQILILSPKDRIVQTNLIKKLKHIILKSSPKNNLNWTVQGFLSVQKWIYHNWGSNKPESILT